jgi:hypothetical protein
MTKQTPLVLVFILIFLMMGFYLKEVSVHSQTIIRDDVPVWPYPAQYSDTIDGASLILDPSRFSFVLKSQSGATLDLTRYPVLDQATQRYPKVIFSHEIDPQVNATGAQPFVVTITLNNGSDQPFVPPPLQSAVDMKEEYTLTVNKDSTCAIGVNSQWGVLRALETLSQLIYFEDEHENFRIDRVPISINDKPRFIVSACFKSCSYINSGVA